MQNVSFLEMQTIKSEKSLFYFNSSFLICFLRSTQEYTKLSVFYFLMFKEVCFGNVYFIKF